MKKNLIYVICMVLMAFTSCQQETEGQWNSGKKGFTVKILVDEMETGVATRSIPSESGETDVNSLYLAFFEYKSDGSGEYQGYYEVPSGAMNSELSITEFTEGTYSASMDYSILAYANLDSYIGTTMTEFIEDLTGKTEKFVFNNTLALTGEGVADETDYATIKIASGNLFMSTRATKSSSETITTVNLKRGVSRFDVVNSAYADRTLASVSVWGAATSTTVWENAKAISPERMQRFYGIETGADDVTEIKGQLYAFENTVINPVLGDKETTCLIIGLKKSGKVTYYRVNIHPDDENQELLRNYCYRITILSALEDGADSEYEAWTQAKNLLHVTVNAWNLDDNGLILTDGVNTLGIPVKRIRLDSRGDVREYSIYTVGTGTLQITKSDLPDGITAVIVGNVLRVTGEPMGNPEDTRRGNIEISFAGLRGSVDIIQEPSNEKVLTLSRYSVATFSPIGRYGMSEGPITVTASGAWTAEIINTYADADNPGFSFNPSGDPVTKIHSASNSLGNLFQLYTTGDNPYSGGKVRNSFIIVSLDEDPDNYSIAVPLTQDKMPSFSITPTVTELGFRSDGTPINQAIAVDGGYKFDVNIGTGWVVALSDDTYFEATKLSTNDGFIVKAKGANGGARRTAVIVVEDDVTPVPNTHLINVYQEAGSIVVTVGGQVPTDGGTIPVTVTAPAGVAWTAEITKQGFTNHPGYINTTGTITATGTGTATFNVGFPKLWYPFVNLTPKVTVKVYLTSQQTVSQTVEVVQMPFNPGTLRVMDVRHSDYGSLGDAPHYFTGFNNFLRSASLFGPYGRVSMPTIAITEVASATIPTPGAANSEFRYLHAGGRPDQYTAPRFQAVENWRTTNDGVVVYVCDVQNANAFTPPATLGVVGYIRAPYAATPRINTALLTSGTTLERNIMKYLLQDGPFGVVNNPASLSFTIDATSTTVSSYSTGVPVMKSSGGNAILVIDPANKLVYIGESQMFYTGYSTAISSAKDRFLGNLLAYILNAAQRGSVFTDTFSDDAKYAKMLQGIYGE